MTPTGTSRGAKAIRASASVQTRNTAPASAAQGSSTRWSGPTRKRTPCGTISPTKPMAPTVATATAVSAAVTTRSSVRVCRTPIPREAAVSVPKESPSRAVEQSHATASPSGVTIAQTTTEFQRAGASEPSSQWVTARVVSASAEAMRTREVRAVNSWPTTTPVRTMRTESSPLRRSNRRSSAKESRAPTRAPPVTPSALAPTPRTTTVTAPVEAPEETPSR
ncbi:hypothetical protein SNARM312S_07131 [Streptomyces narbonensis]